MKECVVKMSITSRLQYKANSELQRSLEGLLNIHDIIYLSNQNQIHSYSKKNRKIKIKKKKKTRGAR